MRRFALLALGALAAAGCAGSNAPEVEATGTLAFIRGEQLWVIAPTAAGSTH